MPEGSDAVADGRGLPLAALHSRHGAQLDERFGTRAVPAHYGSATAEYEAIRHRCALLDRSWTDRLVLSGADRHRFLHGLVTCEIKELAPGAGNYGFLTTVQGRILAEVAVQALDTELWLTLPPGAGAEVASHLDRYVVADDVVFTPLEKALPLTLLGPRSRDLLSRLLTAGEIPSARWAHLEVDLLGHPTRLVREGRWGDDAFTVWIGVGAAESVVETLLAAGERHGLCLVGIEAAETFRIEEGIPWFGRDFGPENLPQETGIAEAVDFTKGCYLGQEIVARIHYRGNVGHAVRGLLFDGDAAPAAGQAVLAGGERVGRLTSAVFSPAWERPLGLAMLDQRTTELGQEIELEDGTGGEVSSLPFQDPDQVLA